MSHRINVPCDGDNGISTIDKIKDTIVFGTTGNCLFQSFTFVDQNGQPYNPPGFTPIPPTPPPDVATVSYSYDGSSIPNGGYRVVYLTSQKKTLGNGSGVIKNT